MPIDRRYDDLYRDQELVYTHGRVVWGAVIQANEALFEPGRANLPAAFVYSTDPAIDADGMALCSLAEALFALKDVPTEPDLMAFSAKLADEIEADWLMTLMTAIAARRTSLYFAVHSRTPSLSTPRLPDVR